MIRYYGMITEDLRNKVSAMTKKAKADYYSNLFDEVKTAAVLKTTEKGIRNNKGK